MQRSRFLIAVSSPWASEKLAEPLGDLARRLNARALVAHVAHTQDDDEHESDARARGEQTLRLLTERLQAQGIDAEGIMLFSDDVSKAILNAARAHDCTMIVLGLTAKGVLKRLIAGDVPGNIIRAADIPVLLVPANWSGSV